MTKCDLWTMKMPWTRGLSLQCSERCRMTGSTRPTSLSSSIGRTAGRGVFYDQSRPVPPKLDTPVHMCYNQQMPTTDALSAYSVVEPSPYLSAPVSHKCLAKSRRPAMKSPQMITRETHLEKIFVEQRQALSHLAVSGSLTGGEPMSKCDCPAVDHPHPDPLLQTGEGQEPHPSPPAGDGFLALQE